MATDTEKTVSEKLGVAFPKSAIKQRQGGGNRRFDYVEGHTVIRRLNEATGNQWDLEVREITTLQIGTSSILQARVALTIPGLGTREHLGVQSVSASGGEDLVKGVITDALKKAATLFGVGLELYGDDYEGTQQPAAPAPSRHTSKETAMKALHATAMEKFAWTHDELRLVAWNAYKKPNGDRVTSLTDLTLEQLNGYIDRLKAIDINYSATTLAAARKAHQDSQEQPETPDPSRAQRFREM